jgi:hypothetical protein
VPTRATVSPYRPLTPAERQTVTGQLTDAYSAAQRDLLRILEQGHITSWRKAFTRQQVAQIESVRGALDSAAARWIDAELPGLYRHGLWVADGHLQPGGLSVAAHPGEWTPMDLGMAQMHDQAVGILGENLALKLTEANSYCAQRLESMVARAQLLAGQAASGSVPGGDAAAVKFLLETATGRHQLAIRDASLQAMQRAFARGDTAREAERAFLSSLRERGVTSFVDRAGREWSMDHYADMVVNTVAAEAERHGIQNRLIEMGEDLVEVSESDHENECEVCSEYEGRILSLTGSTPGYQTVAEAVEAGLLHPYCNHDLLPYLPDDRAA